MNIKLDTKNLTSPEAFGFIIGYYMYDADNVKGLHYSDLPEEAQLYFSYLDSEERKETIGRQCMDTNVYIAEFKGDRFVSDGDKCASSPNFYRVSDWEYTRGRVSDRFELDLEEILYGMEDEQFSERDFNDEFD